MADEKPMSQADQKALSAEWQADHAAAKARDQGEATPSSSTGKAELEKLLFDGKRPEFKQEQKSKEKGREL
jgi:hypothetical protein